MGAKISAAFLLGAGFSQAAGYSSTDDVTKRVLSGTGVYRHTDSTYYLSSPAAVGSYLKPVTQFLAELGALVDRYLARFDGSCGRTCNYEDLSYLAGQIHGSESGEWDNPALLPLHDQLQPAIKRLLANEHGNSIGSLIDLAAEAQNYIADVVWRLLDIPPTGTNHLDLATSALADPDLRVEAIGTLNHDTHFERSLRDRGISLSDGFEKTINDVRYWKPRLLLTRTASVPYLKLHGSIDWFRFRPKGTTWWEEEIGIPLIDDYWHTHDAHGQLQYPIDGRPLLLVGTHNKISEYSSGVFADLHFVFRQRLRKTRVLVVAGYGFGDKGINTAILEWVYSDPKRSIIYIHPDPDAAQARARGAIRNKWDRWLKENVLRLVQERVENVAWPRLKKQVRQASAHRVVLDLH
jgi:hypothetical protein